MFRSETHHVLDVESIAKKWGLTGYDWKSSSASIRCRNGIFSITLRLKGESFKVAITHDYIVGELEQLLGGKIVAVGRKSIVTQDN